MQKERKLQAIRQTLGHEQQRKGSEIVFFCPKHPARAGRANGQLSVNVDTDIFNCWSCGFKGRNLVPLMQKGSVERREYVAELEAAGPSRLVEARLERKYDQPVLPPEFRTLSRSWSSPYNNAALKYLESRGLTREDVLRWKLGYCEDGEYKNRIMIPSFDEHGVLNFVVGRSFYESVQKYKHGNISKDIIFNDYMVDWSKPIVVTEGPFDAFKVRDNVIALQGNILTPDLKLFSKIVTTGVDVFFAMDTDAFDKQLKIIKELFSYGVNCWYVPLGEKKDVGDMTKEQFKSVKDKAVLIESDMDLLRLRVLA